MHNANNEHNVNACQHVKIKMKKLTTALVLSVSLLMLISNITQVESITVVFKTYRGGDHKGALFTI